MTFANQRDRYLTQIFLGLWNYYDALMLSLAQELSNRIPGIRPW